MLGLEKLEYKNYLILIGLKLFISPYLAVMLSTSPWLVKYPRCAEIASPAGVRWSDTGSVCCR